MAGASDAHSMQALLNALPSARPEQPDSRLLSLDEELLVAVLEHLAAQELRRLSLVCACRFREAETLSHADTAKPLTLPERAARNKFERANASRGSSLRAYERGAAEPWWQVLLLLERGLLEKGVLHDVPYLFLADRASGWREGYSDSYSHRTNDHDIDSTVPADARYVMLIGLSFRTEPTTGLKPLSGSFL